MKISLSSMPNQHTTKMVDFPRLDGGLNLWELDYRLNRNQSSEMKNLWWQDGVLQCRDGQSYLYGPSEAQMQSPLPDGVNAWADLGTGYTCASDLFWDYAFFHIGSKLYYMDPAAEDSEMTELLSGVPENRGTFFRYNDWLFYKNRGGFYKIKYNPNGAPMFTASSVTADAYTPTILMNASPSTGSGDSYQPENRLSAKKKVQYNAAEETSLITGSGNGSARVFELGKTAAKDHLTRVSEVYFGSTLVNTALYSTDIASGKVTFTTAPPSDTIITFAAKLGVATYQLPVKELDSVDEVKVDGTVKTEGTDYAVDLSKGTVVFVTAPPVSTPAVNNTVEITYSKANADALNAILDCPYAIVYGGSQSVCIVLGGCGKQPNAFFWNGNDSVGMNAGYWPMSFYNLAGDSEDAITGFGKQYGTLVVFKERSIGKSSYDIETVDDRDSISLTYTAINAKIGCDLPWTIQLIENNLVFCNTDAGVHIVRDSTSALENNIECLSRNVNGTEQRPGLLNDVRTGDVAAGFDDGNRYWVCANGHAYLWDYLLSAWKDPSWFYFTQIPATAFFRTVDKSYHLDIQGRVTVFRRNFMDYGGAIEKVYQFPPQFFDTYDRLKDVLYCIFTVRSDTDSVVRIIYESDYEKRADRTDIRSMSWKLSPRNLAYRCLGIQKFAHVARRKPGCRHARHFSMRLENAERAQDLAILSAQIYFRYLGRDR